MRGVTVMVCAVFIEGRGCCFTVLRGGRGAVVEGRKGTVKRGGGKETNHRDDGSCYYYGYCVAGGGVALTVLREGGRGVVVEGRKGSVKRVGGKTNKTAR